MTKKKAPRPLSRRSSIANKIITDLNKMSGKKVVNLEEVKEGHKMAEDLEASVTSDKELARLDPLHAMYVFAQNRMDVLAEQLTQLPACRKLFSALAEADDIYMPSYPPMSPLTSSYFSCWSLFDFEIGKDKESLSKIAITVSQALSANQNLITLYQRMQESRMGLYVHQGTINKRIILKELVTEKEFHCISPSGYNGRSGELWFARIFPEPFPEWPMGYSVVFTTPYVLGRVKKGLFKKTSSLNDWQLFLERTLSQTGEADRINAYEQLMKYGLNRHYWNEFIFQSYANYTDHVVYLTGIPDLPETLPHAE